MNILQKLKDTYQDFEWYPTTNEIINAIKPHLEESDSVLDCGAGDGRVLSALTSSKKYAIEKAVPLIQAMPADIVIVGTDFWESTLIDKKVDIVFCNPPYSEYLAWAAKIISEAHARKIFLVLPARWRNSGEIEHEIKNRGKKAGARVIGTFDFLNAERQARVQVELLEITLENLDYHSNNHNDPFENWFNNEFHFHESEDQDEDYQPESTTLRDKLAGAVVSGRGKIPFLIELYDHEMAHLYENFKQITSLDGDLLKELGTNKEAIREAMKQRIAGLKNLYWNELFDNLHEITSRLTTSRRKNMLYRLTDQTNVDFTETNIYAVLIWVIKNANQYYDQQLIENVERLISEANVSLYKSNQRLYKWDHWRSGQYVARDLSHFQLELRIVLHRYQAAISVKDKWGYIVRSWDHTNSLHNSAHDFIDDLLVIANNLNFKTWPGMISKNAGEWESGKKKDFIDIDGNTLIQVKAFKNGNLHIKFSQKLIRRLNVEFGRLKGWLRTPEQAAEEMDIPVKDAETSFKINNQLEIKNLKLLENN